MAATVCPTITADNPEEYLRQMETAGSFATRIHVDVADGVLAPRKLIGLDKLCWPANKFIDLHVMYDRPLDYIDILLSLSPQLIIVHAEAEGNFIQFAQVLRARGIEAGIALLPKTTVDKIKPALEYIDHVLIFSGNLGYQGGSEADLSLLEKAKKLRALKPGLEIGWDGGVNDQNAKKLADGGIDVLNVGGFIQAATDPVDAYDKLKELTEK